MPPDDPAPGEDEVLPPQRRPRGLQIVSAVALLVIATFVVVRLTRTSAPSPTATTSTPLAGPTSVSPATTATSPPTVMPTALVAVTELGHPLLGVRAPYELFGRGDGTVVRIQFARGRITTTAVPALGSSGPVSFLVGSHEAVVRPIDFVPGYLIPDGRPAVQVPPDGSLGQSGPAFPGPDPDHVWAPSQNSNPPTLGLVGLDDNRAGPVLPVPTGASILSGTPDGAGYVLYPGAGGTYEARPYGLRRITTGTVVAVGPTRWLVRECAARCRLVVVDQHSGARRALDTPASDQPVVPGTISPDGRTAAFVTASIEVVDLTTGAQHALSLRVDPGQLGLGQSLVWSPDSSMLFALDANGALYAVAARTGAVTDVSLPADIAKLSQLAVRA